MHMVLAYALPLTLRNAWTCMAQVKDTSALAGASQDDGRNPTPSSRPISASTTICRQWSREIS